MLSVLTLRNEKTDEHYDVLNKKINLVGRAGFDNNLEISDTSVSRCHAEIFFVKKAIWGAVKLLLIVVDKQSKFGTFVNSGIELNKRIKSNCPVVLKLNDRIRFGAMDSIWTIVKYPIVVCPSTLKKADKDVLNQFLTKIEGQVSRDWTNQCTHLCMNSVTITEKVLLCLASVKSIVSMKYFLDLCDALSPNSSIELPYCIDYQPELVENILNPNSLSLNLNNKRRSLFFGKTFVCSTVDQLNRISKIVKAAGGEIINYFEGVISDNDILCRKEYILMQQDPHSTENSEEYLLILDKIKTINRRPIPENDIGLAIIFSSTEKHCNPFYNVSLVNLQSQTNQTTSQSSVILAPETEVLTVGDSEISSVNVVPDSLCQSQDHFKRPLDVVMDSEEIVISKKKLVLLSNDEEENHNEKIKKTKEDLKLSKKMIESTPFSTNNCTYKSLEYEKTIDSDTLQNADSCLTTVQSSQDISNENVYSPCVQANTIEEENMKVLNNNLSKGVVNNNAAVTKRKLSSICSIINNDDADPFDYMDIDEIEERAVKKPKKDPRESIFFPVLATSSNNEDKQSNSQEPTDSCVKDQNVFINLLAKAKGTGQFIDASKPPDKSSVSVHESTNEDDDLLNSVIVETVSLVVSKPVQTRNVQEDHSNIRNFKKFKRKGPVMKIPRIVSLQLDQTC